MVIAFVLIDIVPSKEHAVYNELSDVKEIVELHPLVGDYDIIAKIEADDLDVLARIVVDKIRSIPGVIETKTLAGITLSTAKNRCNG
jgi:DNA-binding Lrp family transcriptional regulator